MIISAICVPIIGPSIGEAKEQIMRADRADLIELRLDQILYRNVEELKPLLTKHPVIFTLKEAINGAKLSSLLALDPDYVDVERERVKAIAPLIPSHIKLIASYHNEAKTPEDLEKLVQEGFLCKIATHANSATDALRMLKLCRSHPGLIGVCMGPYGIATRVLAPLFGAPWTYSALDEDHKTAPGQIPIDLLWDRYCIKKITSQTKILGVMGHPVENSPGIAVHNQVFSDLGIDAVYLPFSLTKGDLPLWFSLADELNLYGMSVTMPLKEEVAPYLENGKGLGAVNTLLNRTGANFDGVGALDAIGNAIGTVKDRRIAIIGAGGAACAIAIEAKKRGGKLLILNRTLSRAAALAKKVEGEYGSLDTPFDADIVIQCTSVGMESGDFLPIQFPKGALVLDIVTRPLMTRFLQEAEKKGCQTLTGMEMWIRQAAYQLNFWFSIPQNRALAAIRRALT